jgi:hypothetical protein
MPIAEYFNLNFLITANFHFKDANLLLLQLNRDLIYHLQAQFIL